ncbi:hypothetical protein LCGC14_0637680 [marine sediment metagenome]|uniref:Uncharacterized protein n=1 Tax=marine sediment metagenome TaxID=412755 RepID=A0A0F9RJF6_9ZZZZ
MPRSYLTDKGLIIPEVANCAPEPANHGTLYTGSDNILRFCDGDAVLHAVVFDFTVTDWTTFTPTVTLVGGAGNTVPVYTTNSGRYVQYGKMVYVDVFLDGDGGAEGAGTGQINIALPVAAGASLNGNGVGQVGLADNGAGENYPLYGSIAQGGTTISLERWTSIKVLAALDGDDQDNVVRCLNLHFWYEVD